jgi:hypothetical protein
MIPEAGSRSGSVGPRSVALITPSYRTAAPFLTPSWYGLTVALLDRAGPGCMHPPRTTSIFATRPGALAILETRDARAGPDGFRSLEAPSRASSPQAGP